MQTDHPPIRRVVTPERQRQRLSIVGNALACNHFAPAVLTLEIEYRHIPLPYLGGIVPRGHHDATRNVGRRALFAGFGGKFPVDWAPERKKRKARSG